ncbi:cytochrome c oxidase assembly factor CtaG [Paenibacillus koleovorans]|uniref:cytochrome c oxidase assembly factor CtaG n=1 Tax=Paenibacillus koleovorans TaxID=121608 RepID=UPI000FD86336|nr:cytochrome c oxidase assembly factor CtaG [Paenibacillus koleovorans]
MLGLQYFSFSEIWSPLNMVIAILIAVAYLGLIGPYRTKVFRESEPVSVGKALCFLLGLLVYYMAHGGPIDLLGHLMFSAHMTSMTLAYLVAPPLMLLGIPGWMIRPLIRHPRAKKVFAFLTHPMLTVFIFNVLFSFYHMPFIHDYVMTHFTVHRILFFVLLVSAFMMWWPVLNPTPEVNPISELKKMAYIFSMGVLITPACALLIFADSTIYATYNDPAIWAQAMGYCVPTNAQALLQSFSGGPADFLLLGAQEDQQLGGVIMKVAQEIVYGWALGYVFFSWYGREKGDDNEMEPGPAAV